ncbi:MAG: glycosyl hydrolase, partial [Pseudomonadota bacterium]
MQINKSKSQVSLAIAGFSLVASLAGSAHAQSPAEAAAEAMQSVEWRAIGPANMGGRVTDIDGVPGDPSTFYVSGADGGVFRTTNGGVTFDTLFTDEKSYSVGALTIAPSDRNVIWLGSGEGDPRNSVGYGHGIYRSNDAGDSWTHLGLDKTERIKRIVVHPDNPDVALVCALGRQFGPNRDR